MWERAAGYRCRRDGAEKQLRSLERNVAKKNSTNLNLRVQNWKLGIQGIKVEKCG